MLTLVKCKIRGGKVVGYEVVGQVPGDGEEQLRETALALLPHVAEKLKDKEAPPC